MAGWLCAPTCAVQDVRAGGRRWQTRAPQRFIGPPVPRSWVCGGHLAARHLSADFPNLSTTYMFPTCSQLHAHVHNMFTTTCTCSQLGYTDGT
eukprot:272854-Chlamydomonas_euryale.AAC.1